MAQLHELLAVMADTGNAAQAIKDETITTFQKRDDHFKGLTRATVYFDEGRQAENTSDSKEIVTTVDSKLDHAFHLMARHYDALLQQEEANTRAKADLVVNGVTIMKDVPATFLLGMEGRLKSLREMLMFAPTLEPATKWEEDPNKGEGVFVSPSSVQMKTEKTLKSKVLYEATDKHPAQVEKWNEDVPVARIEAVHLSGKISPADKSAMMGRVDQLISAVKKARQRANCVEVSNLNIAKAMFDYIRGV